MAGGIILGLIGLLLGSLLVLANHYLYVEEDKGIEEITKMLPGYNCGACGFPGCNGFAQKIVEEKNVDLTLCKPGKKALHFDKINEYLKQERNKS